MTVASTRIAPARPNVVDGPQRSRSLEARLAAVLTVALAGSGCSTAADPTLVVASPWPTEVVARRAGIGATPIRVVRVDPADLRRLIATRAGFDLVVGASPSLLEAMTTAGLVEPGWRTLDPAEGSPAVGIRAAGDPRRDPAELELAAARLAAGAWRVGYAALVKDDEARDESTAAGSGLAVVSGSPHGSGARAVLDRWPAAPTDRALPSQGGLLADLLGATLIDGREERLLAVAAVEAAGRPDDWEARLVEPPPWPPASVAKLRSDPATSPLADTLAEQIATAGDVRAWLLASWDAPRRPIDDRILADLEGALGGRLMAEPRFRAWLRAEWATWARQRYRWIAREAGRGRPAPPSAVVAGTAR